LKIRSLKNKKLIDQLFKSKAIVVKNEFRVSRINGNEDPPFFCVSVPKKYFKRAVDRNKIKRRIKAALNNLETKVRGNYLVIYVGLDLMNTEKIKDTLNDIFNLSD